MKTILMLLFLTAVIQAQTFSVSVDDVSKSDTLNSEIVFVFSVTNLSTANQTIDIVRTLNELPESWSSSLCFSLCFAPFVDSISTTRDFGSSPLSAGEMREFTVHIFPLVNQGTAHVNLLVKNAMQPSESHSFELTANADVTGITENGNLIENYSLGYNYPNPFNPSTKINYSVYKAGTVKINLYNSLGQIVGRLVNQYKQSGKYQLNIEMNNFSTGVYFVGYTINEFHDVRKIILEK